MAACSSRFLSESSGRSRSVAVCESPSCFGEDKIKLMLGNLEVSFSSDSRPLPVEAIEQGTGSETENGSAANLDAGSLLETGDAFSVKDFFKTKNGNKYRVLNRRYELNFSICQIFSKAFTNHKLKKQLLDYWINIEENFRLCRRQVWDKNSNDKPRYIKEIRKKESFK